jgi:hypothetical protein
LVGNFWIANNLLGTDREPAMTSMLETLPTTREADGRVIAFVEGFGLRPVPRSFQSQIVNWKIRPAPSPALRAWQAFVRERAIEAMNGRDPYDGGPVWCEITLIARTPYGWRHGDVWGQNVRWDGASKRAVRTGKTEPDFDNAIKSLLDGCKEIIFADDVQVRCLDGSRMIYGPEPGFRLIVRRLGEGQ